MSAEYTVVAMPTELDGHPVRWGGWEEPLLLSHVQFECGSCDWENGPRMTYGFIEVQRRRRGGVVETRRVIAYTAFRCPRCQECRIYRMGGVRPAGALPSAPPLPRWEVVAYLPPRTAQADLPVPDGAS